jgi:hypothetical protein
MSPSIQSLESRRLFSAAPSQAVLDATAKVQADLLQIKTDTAAFHTAIAATNAAFGTAKSVALNAIKSDLGAGSPLGSFIGHIINTALATDRQVLHDAIAAHNTGLKADVAQWKATHLADLQTLHTDIAALHHAKTVH